MKARKPRQYSPERKLAALAALARNGGDLYRTAKELHIPNGTLSGWVRQAQARGEPLPQGEVALDERLEQLARQMVAVMPEKVEEASLQELARALTIVLGTMNQARAGKEESGDVYEKLARLMDRYAATGAAGGSPEPTDEDGSGSISL